MGRRARAECARLQGTIPTRTGGSTRAPPPALGERSEGTTGGAMKPSMRTKCAFAVTLATLLAAPLAAADQPARDEQSGETQATGKTEKGQGVEEMVITARKREENLQDTPIAVTAISGGEV